MFSDKLPETKVIVPMPKINPTREEIMDEFNRLYLEKCQEVNRLELLMDGQKAMLEERSKEIDSLKSRLNTTEAAYKEAVEKNERMKADWLDAAIYSLKAAPSGELPQLPESLLEETVTTQDILCLSSAIKNLYEIKKCDTFTLYLKLCRVLEKKIEEYCNVEG